MRRDTGILAPARAVSQCAAGASPEWQRPVWAATAAARTRDPRNSGLCPWACIHLLSKFARLPILAGATAAAHVDSGVAIAHLPIDVRAAGAIGVEAVHVLRGHDVHRVAAEGKRVLDVLAGPQNPNDEGPVYEGSSAQVLTAGQRATSTGGCCDDRSRLVSRQGRGGRSLDARPRLASRRGPRGVMATGVGDHAMPGMAGAGSTVAPRAPVGPRRGEPGSIR